MSVKEIKIELKKLYDYYLEEEKREGKKGEGVSEREDTRG